MRSVECEAWWMRSSHYIANLIREITRLVCPMRPQVSMKSLRIRMGDCSKIQQLEILHAKGREETRHQSCGGCGAERHFGTDSKPRSDCCEAREKTDYMRIAPMTVEVSKGAAFIRKDKVLRIILKTRFLRNLKIRWWETAQASMELSYRGSQG